MATMILSGAGAAIGSAFGPLGTMLGRAGGALLGSALDRRLFGTEPPSRAIEGPRLGAVRLATAEEGLPIPRAYGTVRAGGHLIWATRFEEVTSVEEHGGRSGGKGPRPPNGPTTTTTTYAYHANAAYAVCEGPIDRVRRVWADGRELDLSEIDMRVYRGTEDQLPDPLIAAKQGGDVPAYRGTAYVVFERLALEPFGNRLPQFSFEVIRGVNSVARDLRAITIIPGATEYGYDPLPVTEMLQPGESVSRNRHQRIATSDWTAAIDELQALCPNLETVSLVVSWFGDDLDCGRCRIEPRVETNARPGVDRAWSVAGVSRANARTVSWHDGGPAYGGTPSDASVVAAIRDLRARGLRVFLYPFVLMDIAPGNGLDDPYGGAEQAAYPWRGRITVSPAPGRDGTPDGSAGADVAVARFLGSASAPNYAAFVAHCASLAVAAGSVDGFVIGSELRGLTWVQGANGHPFVDGLRSIAAASKAALGPGTTVTYAADWTEWYGHQPPDRPGDLLYHLDPLWADPAIDAIGIDCYVPLGDYRDSDALDGGLDGTVSALDVAALRRAITGGEGFDWFYASEADRAARVRTPITDGAHAKPWVWRVKDLASWWSNVHVERRSGVENGPPTAWVPGSKPIILTEVGAPAVDRAANQPNVFPDPKSSEDAAPHHSSGARDDAAQHAVLRAHLDHWRDDGPVDPADVFLWTWDARPAPAFPLRSDIWSDGANWSRGHWLNGRLSGAPIGEIIAAVLADHGFGRFDVTGVDGFAAGLLLDDPATARASLDAVLETHAIGVAERDGVLEFRSLARPRLPIASLSAVAVEGAEPDAVRTRAREIDLPEEIALAHRDPMRDHGVATALVRGPGRNFHRAAVASPLVLEGEHAAATAATLLRAFRDGRETVELAVPWRDVELRAGDTVQGPSPTSGRWLVEAIEDGSRRRLSLRSVLSHPSAPASAVDRPRPVVSPDPVGAPRVSALDLPLLPGREAEGGAAMAAWMRPWRPLVVLTRGPDGALRPRAAIDAPATLGTLVEPLRPGVVGPFDRANAIMLDCPAGAFASASERAVLDGANAVAVRCGVGWEVLQFAWAEEIEPGRWRLWHLLRASLGTEVAMRSGAEPGADVVMLEGSVVPLDVDASERGEPTEWLVGPSGVVPDQARFASLTAGLGLRAITPLAPVHLRAIETGDGLVVNWTRRSRVDADSWTGEDVPLGEERERYRARLTRGGLTLVIETDQPLLVVPTELAGGVGSLVVEIAQIGAVGEGHRARIVLP